MAKNVEVEQGKIVCNPRTPSMPAMIIYTVVYLGLMMEGAKELIRAIHEGRGPVPALLILAVFTAIWLFLMRNAGSRIVFDAAAKKVYKKTVFGTREMMDFADIGLVGPVEEGGNCGKTSTYYKVSPSGDRYGKGIRLTASFDDKRLLEFETLELPLLHKLLYLSGAAPEARAEASAQSEAGAAQSPSAAPPEETYCYRKAGAVYTRGYRLRPFITIALGILALAYGLSTAVPDNRLFALIMAAALLLLGLFAQTSISLNTTDRSITLATMLGLRKKVFSFDDFDGLKATRETVNLIPTGTYLHMNIASRKTPILLGKAYLSSKKLDRLGEETLAILAAGQGGSDN